MSAGIVADEIPIDGDDDVSDGEEKEEVHDLGIKFKLDKADISAFVDAYLNKELKFEPRSDAHDMYVIN